MSESMTSAQLAYKLERRIAEVEDRLKTFIPTKQNADVFKYLKNELKSAKGRLDLLKSRDLNTRKGAE